jgi:nicotinamidase-related amidase
MARKINLILIDPQCSFCKVVDPAQQQAVHDGELCVPNAWDDMVRVSKMIARLGRKIDRIWVTLDSHQWNHIAHPNWFKDQKGNPPGPFTIMRVEFNTIIGSQFGPSGPHDVGTFTTTVPGLYVKTLNYLQDLATGKRYPHCIWPPHTLIGTPGHNVVEPLMSELLNWCRANFRTIEFVTKGSNPFVEHFSAVRSEVVDPDDPTTQLNSQFIQNVMEGDEILLAGEAGSHCLANTVSDMADSFGDDSFISKCVLLTDGTSPVPGFDQLQTDFVAKMTKRGMKTTTTGDYLK